MITRNKSTKQDVLKMEAALEAAESIIDDVTDMIWRGEGGEIVKSLASDEIALIYYTLCDAMVPIADALSYKRNNKNAVQDDRLSVRDKNAHSNGIRRLQEALQLADWEYESADSKKAQSEGRCSIDVVADYFASLNLSERELGEKLMNQHVPPKWAMSWNKIVKNALDRKSQAATERAQRVGALSPDPETPNFKANFSYSYSQDGHDYFRHNKTGELISSPDKEPRKSSRSHKQCRTPNL